MTTETQVQAPTLAEGALFIRKTDGKVAIVSLSTVGFAHVKYGSVRQFVVHSDGYMTFRRNRSNSGRWLRSEEEIGSFLNRYVPATLEDVERLRVLHEEYAKTAYPVRVEAWKNFTEARDALIAELAGRSVDGLPGTFSFEPIEDCEDPDDPSWPVIDGYHRKGDRWNGGYCPLVDKAGARKFVEWWNSFEGEDDVIYQWDGDALVEMSPGGSEYRHFPRPVLTSGGYRYLYDVGFGLTWILLEPVPSEDLIVAVAAHLIWLDTQAEMKGDRPTHPSGKTFASCESFSDIHDIVDGNEYLIAAYSPGIIYRPRWDEFTDRANRASERIDAWLKSGGHVLPEFFIETSADLQGEEVTSRSVDSMTRK